MRRFLSLWNASREKWQHKLLSGILLAIVIASAFLPAGCKSLDSFDSQYNKIVSDYRFSLVSFHLNALAGEIGKVLGGGLNVSAKDADSVVKYFTAPESSEESREKAEAILEAQVREAYREAGIFQPFTSEWWAFSFPPFNFHLDEPPFLLIVSPRDSISRYREALLVSCSTLEEIERIEENIEELGYSALVVRLGGVATYPAYVSNHAGIKQALSIGAEEWLHQYLAFKPLGFRYVLHLLGIQKDSEIVTMNETVAGIVSDEIAEKIYSRYYDKNQNDEEVPGGTVEFDFNAAMRETRIQVDKLLEEGEILEAEAYMAARRDFIEANGYYIRKLNQAYFAFYGSYADSPASVDPIGDELRTLRMESDNVESFLNTVAGFRGRQDLKCNLE